MGALATHRQTRPATCAYDGVVTSSSIATGCETIIRIKYPATSRPITFLLRHSSISHLKSAKCLAGRPSSLWIQITSSEAILRRRECNQQGQQLFPPDRDARHVCRAGTILQSTLHNLLSIRKRPNLSTISRRARTEKISFWRREVYCLQAL